MGIDVAEVDVCVGVESEDGDIVGVDERVDVCVGVESEDVDVEGVDEDVGEDVAEDVDEDEDGLAEVDVRRNLDALFDGLRTISIGFIF